MAEHIKITGTSPIAQYVADGVSTTYWYSFQIFQAADLEVWLDSVRQTHGYTVSGAGATSGGSVTFNTAPEADVIVTLRRALVIERITDFQDSGEFTARAINDELDYQTAALQEVAAAWSRSLRLSFLAPADVDLALTGTADELDGKVVKFVKDGTTLKLAAETLASGGGGGGGPGGLSGQYNGLDYGADPSGTLPSAAAINAAIDTAFAAGGGMVWLPAGTYALEAPVILKRGVWVVGVAGKTVLRLGINANCNMVESYKFEELKAASAYRVEHDPDYTQDYGLINLILDGNRVNQDGTDLVYGCKLYGRRVTLDQLIISEIKGIGLWTCSRGSHGGYNNTTTKGPAKIHGVHIIDCDDEGWIFDEMSDTSVDDIVMSEIGDYNNDGTVPQVSRMFPGEPVHCLRLEGGSLELGYANLNGARFGHGLYVKSGRIHANNLIVAGCWGSVYIESGVFGWLNILSSANNKAWPLAAPVAFPDILNLSRDIQYDTVTIRRSGGAAIGAPAIVEAGGATWQSVAINQGNRADRGHGIIIKSNNSQFLSVDIQGIGLTSVNYYEAYGSAVIDADNSAAIIHKSGTDVLVVARLGNNLRNFVTKASGVKVILDLDISYDSTTDLALENVEQTAGGENIPGCVYSSPAAAGIEANSLDASVIELTDSHTSTDYRVGGVAHRGRIRSARDVTLFLEHTADAGGRVRIQTLSQLDTDNATVFEVNPRAYDSAGGVLSLGQLAAMIEDNTPGAGSGKWIFNCLEPVAQTQQRMVTLSPADGMLITTGPLVLLSGTNSYAVFGGAKTQRNGTATATVIGDAHITGNLTVGGTSPGGGAIDTSGTPAAGQVVTWVDNNTVQGDTNLTWSSGTLTINGSGTNTLQVHQPGTGTVVTAWRTDKATVGNLAIFRFQGDDSSGGVSDYANMEIAMETITAGAEAGAFVFSPYVAGIEVDKLYVGEFTVINGTKAARSGTQNVTIVGSTTVTGSLTVNSALTSAGIAFVSLSGTVSYSRINHAGRVLRATGAALVLNATNEAQFQSGDAFTVRQIGSNNPTVNLPAGAVVNGTPAWRANAAVTYHCVGTTAGSYTFDLTGSIS